MSGSAWSTRPGSTAPGPTGWASRGTRSPRCSAPSCPKDGTTAKCSRSSSPASTSPSNAKHGPRRASLNGSARTTSSPSGLAGPQVPEDHRALLVRVLGQFLKDAEQRLACLRQVPGSELCVALERGQADGAEPVHPFGARGSAPGIGAGSDHPFCGRLLLPGPAGDERHVCQDCAAEERLVRFPRGLESTHPRISGPVGLPEFEEFDAPGEEPGLGESGGESLAGPAGGGVKELSAERCVGGDGGVEGGRRASCNGKGSTSSSCASCSPRASSARPDETPGPASRSATVTSRVCTHLARADSFPELNSVSTWDRHCPRDRRRDRAGHPMR